MIAFTSSARLIAILIVFFGIVACRCAPCAQASVAIAQVEAGKGVPPDASDEAGSSEETPERESSDSEPEETSATEKIDVPDRIEVAPTARDDEIEERLHSILRATGWFERVEVDVEDGVVFIEGGARDERQRQWAAELAGNTEGVAAVVNRLELAAPSAWDFQPAWREFHSLWRGFVSALPLIAVAIVVIFLSWWVGRFVKKGVEKLLEPRVASRLLRAVAARALGIVFFLAGVYLILRVAGLTQLAVTVVGGTGLIGLILGIAFRDITENFLASLFLSLQQPFREGDLVEIEGAMGYVQRLTSRTTILTTLEGNQVQVPNSTVFKSTIRNYTSNPNRRVDFTIGIGYEAAISHAQDVALDVLRRHPAVLSNPEPWVLVDSLGAATVNLRIYFWLDGSQHSWLKVRSSVIRLVKRAMQEEGVSLPDEAREVIFPNGVPVRMLEADPAPSGDLADRRSSPPRTAAPRDEDASTQAEGGLHSEAGEIEEQSRKSWSPNQGENLLAGETRPASSDEA